MKISILIASYNHAKYIESCIESILSQSYKNLEIIISDDCSQDDTDQKIKKFTDKRLKYFKQEKKIGICENFNFITSKSSGDLICYCGSDDTFEKNKLESQIEFMILNNLDFSFTHVNFIDENDKVIDNKNNSKLGLFNVENRSKRDWLKFFFQYGNILNAPSSMFKSSIKDYLYFDKNYKYLHDFNIILNLLSDNYRFKILEKKLVNYRVHKTNSSNYSKENVNLDFFENILIKYDQLKKISPMEQKEIFSCNASNSIDNLEKQRIMFLLNSNNFSNQILAFFYILMWRDRSKNFNLEEILEKISSDFVLFDTLKYKSLYNEISSEIVTERNFSEKNYLNFNIDVKKAIENGSIKSAFEHFMKYGRFENRKQYKEKNDE